MRAPRHLSACVVPVLLAALTACRTAWPVALPECEQATPGARGIVVDAERLLEQNEPAAALGCLQQVIAEEPHYFRAWRAYQDALYETAGPQAALQFSLARLTEQKDAAAHVLVARVTEDEEAAARHLQAALDADPTFHWALLGQGILAARAARFEEAEALFTAAIDLYPEFGAARLARARVRDQIAEFEGAAEDYRHYLKSSAGDTEALYNLASITHRELHRPDQAEEYYRVLLDIDHRRTDAVVGLAVCLTEEGRYEAARALYDSIQRQEPSALFNLGMLYQEHLNRPEEARRCFQEFIDWGGPRSEIQSDADRLIYAPVRLAELERARPRSGAKGDR